MFGKNKRGQATFNKFVYAFLIIFVVLVAVLAFTNNPSGDLKGYIFGIQQSLFEVTEWVEVIFYPLLGGLLGLGSSDNTDFLMVLSFFLTLIVITAALDSVEIFDGHLINLFMGVIVAAIGVRFMPDNLWLALTTPSSAFVATLLVGMPFLAMFFVAKKFKYSVMGKIAWILYILILGYILLGPTVAVPGAASGDAQILSAGGFEWIYILFLILGILQLLFDKQINGFVDKFREGKNLEKNEDESHRVSRSLLRKEMAVERRIITDGTATEEDIKASERKLVKLEKQYKKVS